MGEPIGEPTLHLPNFKNPKPRITVNSKKDTATIRRNQPSLSSLLIVPECVIHISAEEDAEQVAEKDVKIGSKY